MNPAIEEFHRAHDRMAYELGTDIAFAEVFLVRNSSGRTRVMQHRTA